MNRRIRTMLTSLMLAIACVCSCFFMVEPITAKAWSETNVDLYQYFQETSTTISADGSKLPVGVLSAVGSDGYSHWKAFKFHTGNEERKWLFRGNGG